MSPEDYKLRFGDGRLSAAPRLNALSGGRAYDAARWDSREMASWTPPLTSGVDENLEARDAVTRRARDLVRNHPIISGATDRRVESAIGPNIRLETQPAWELLGQGADWADQWSANTEQQFELWSRDPRKLCDAEQHLQFGGLVELAYRHWWNDGEAAAVIKMLPATGNRVLAGWETCVEIVDPDRISNPNGLPDYHRTARGRTLIGGIEYDVNKAPVAAHVRVAHPAGWSGGLIDGFRWQRVPFYGPTGRPVFVHAFKRNRADQRRGISRFVAAIKRIKMFDRYDDAEVEAALLNAVMAAWVESPAPTDEVAQAMAPGSPTDSEGVTAQAMMEYRMRNPVRVAGARVIHGLPGEKLSFQRAEHPSANYPEFQATGLRAISAALGLSYSQVAQNWADINYSSARAMLNEIWRGLMHDSWLFSQAFCTPIYLAWLEESVARGYVAVPGGRKTGFYRRRNALSMCEWIGPGRGSVDPLKEAQAHDFELNQGATDMIALNNERGQDWRKTLFKQSRVAKYRGELGIDPYVPLKAGAGLSGSDDEASGGVDAARDEEADEEAQSRSKKTKEPA